MIFIEHPPRNVPKLVSGEWSFQCTIGPSIFPSRESIFLLRPSLPAWQVDRAVKLRRLLAHGFMSSKIMDCWQRQPLTMVSHLLHWLHYTLLPVILQLTFGRGTVCLTKYSSKTLSIISYWTYMPVAWLGAMCWMLHWLHQRDMVPVGCTSQ